MRIIKHKNVLTRKINKVSEHKYLLTFSSMLGQPGSLSLCAINLETGISEPHQQICHVTNRYGHVTNRYGQLTISQWAYRFLTGFYSCIFTHND